MSTYLIPKYERKADNTWGIAFKRRKISELTTKEKEFFTKTMHLNRTNEEDAEEYRQRFIEFAGPYPEE